MRSATKWIKVGDHVKFMHPNLNEGERWLGMNDAWLCVGAEGIVTEIRKGYAAHPCPDHREYPDCVCGDEGTIPALGSWAVVSYQTDKPGVFIKRAIRRSDEGDSWCRAK